MCYDKSTYFNPENFGKYVLKESKESNIFLKKVKTTDYEQ